MNINEIKKFLNDKIIKKILNSEREENREYLIRVVSAITGIEEYIFICDNKKLLDYIYSGDNIMEKIRENFKDYVSELDEMLYY